MIRLLNIDSLELREFYHDVPSYAVASHRWLEDECTFQSFMSMPYASLQGFTKIRAFCSFMQRNRLIITGLCSQAVRWLWVDTCCIDKTNSTELSEAINSMFEWYAGATICLAYLFDVPSKAFKQSTWFERGWTLQELLSPGLVVFLSSDWKVLGHKAGKGSVSPDFMGLAGACLNEVVAARTGIPITVLEDISEVEDMPFDMILSWMEGRETLRQEDQAYCLLGIFDVNLPLIYGEGQRAHVRLLEALLAKYSRTSPETSTVMVQLSERIYWLEIERSKRRRLRHRKFQSTEHGMSCRTPDLTRNSRGRSTSPLISEGAVASDHSRKDRGSRSRHRSPSSLRDGNRKREYICNIEVREEQRPANHRISSPPAVMADPDTNEELPTPPPLRRALVPRRMPTHIYSSDPTNARFINWTDADADADLDADHDLLPPLSWTSILHQYDELMQQAVDENPSAELGKAPTRLLGRMRKRDAEMNMQRSEEMDSDLEQPDVQVPFPQAQLAERGLQDA